MTSHVNQAHYSALPFELKSLILSEQCPFSFKELAQFRVLNKETHLAIDRGVLHCFKKIIKEYHDLTPKPLIKNRLITAIETQINEHSTTEDVSWSWNYLGALYKSVKYEFVHQPNIQKNQALPPYYLCKQLEKLHNDRQTLFHQYALTILKQELISQHPTIFANLQNYTSAEDIRTQLSQYSPDVLKQVIHLDLSNKTQSPLSIPLQIIPPEIRLFSSLKHLNLSNNPIKEIQPDAFYGLKNLEFLSLCNIEITHLPLGVFQDLENLISLVLDNNPLQELAPNCFQGLKKLCNLSLHQTSITEIKSGTFNDLENLNNLSLNSNYNLKTITPDSFQGLKKLTLLDLGMSHIEEIQPGAFNGLETLTQLLLSNNEIKTLQLNTFQGLNNLTALTLQMNRIEEIQPGAFNDLTHLKTLLLNYNLIKELKSNTFQGLENLQTLDFEENPIQEVALDAFNSLKKVTTINLRSTELTEIQKSQIQQNTKAKLN